MHVGQISFCDGVGYNIKSDEDKERISKELKAFEVSVLSRHFERFGGESTLNAIKSNPHLLSVRTHGNPYYLYLTTINGINQCIFVDKKIQHGYFQPRMILTKLWFHSDLFSGTIFDGEMVRSASTSTWTFIINDIIVDCRSRLGNVNLVRRVNRVYELMSNSYVHDGMDVCQIQVKRYFAYGELNEMVSTFIPKLPYEVRGIIFKSLFLKFKDILVDLRDETDIRIGLENMRSRRTKVSTGFTLHSKVHGQEQDPVQEEVVVGLEKEKNQVAEKTFDIKKTNLPDVYELFDRALNTRELACIPNLAVSKFMRTAFANIGVSSTLQMRCTFHDRFKKWVPDACCQQLLCN